MVVPNRPPSSLPPINSTGSNDALVWKKRFVILAFRSGFTVLHYVLYSDLNSEALLQFPNC